MWTRIYKMTSGNEEVNDVNSPVQTQESEMGDAELQVDDYKWMLIE